MNYGCYFWHDRQDNSQLANVFKKYSFYILSFLPSQSVPQNVIGIFALFLFFFYVYDNYNSTHTKSIMKNDTAKP